MLTNPSTLGLFERRIVELLDAIHAAGALAYMDGANMNAILGRFKPGAAGFDVMHFNLHKTFSTPHGGGGPGAGPVAVSERLAPFLPGPQVVRDADGSFRLERPASGRRRSAGCAPTRAASGVLVRAYAYIRTHGGAGLRQVSDDAVLAANYLRERVGEAYELPFEGPCKHEFVATRAAAPGGDGHPHAGHRQAAHRLRLPPADHLFPVARRGVPAHRAHRDRDAGGPRRVRGRAAGGRARRPASIPSCSMTRP